MNRDLYLYALIKTLYDKGEDFIDSFWPFVVQVASDSTPKTLAELKEDLKKKFSLDVPTHVLKTIVSRAKNKGYLRLSNNQYLLTKHGRDVLGEFEDEEDVQRRIDALMADVVDFFASKRVLITAHEAYSAINKFVQANLGAFIEYINPGSKILETSFVGEEKKYDSLLVEYLIEVQSNRLNQYAVLKEMVYGSIISSILYVPEETNINEIKETKFDDCTVYLDSNVALAVLGLTSKETTEPAQELIKLMKDLGIEIRIYDFTVYQIRTIIGAFAREYDKYDPSIEVDTIHSHMQIAGWLPSDVPDYLLNLDSKFEEKGVGVEYTDISIDNEKPQSDKFETLKKYKSVSDSTGEGNDGPSIASLNHDLVAIRRIKEIRKRHATSIEKSKAIFITSDVKLNWFNFIEYGHRDAHTIAEVILDRIFANILWLKKPNIELPLKSIIASHTKNLFVKRPIWKKFYDELKKAEQEGKVTDEQVSLLFYNKDTEAVLRKFGEHDTDQVTEAFILKSVAEAEDKIKSQIEKAKEGIREEFLQKLKQSEEERRLEEEKRNTRLEGKLDEVRQGIYGESKKSAKFWIFVTSCFVDVSIFGISYWLVEVRRVISVDTLQVLFTLTGGSALGIVILSVYVGKKLLEPLTSIIYRRRIKRLKL